MKNWKKLLQDNFYLILLVGLILSFFYPVFLQRKIPISADTIVGMYHPWRDKVWDRFTAGVPFKNFLITDPVRQQYVWRSLAIEQLKNREIPLWNPYSFGGTPLLANFQSAPFYPFNILYFIFSFNLAWTIQIILQPLLAGIFLYLYLRFIKVSQWGSLLGGFTFAFSGFSIAWLEWNTIGHVIVWLSLTLLAIEKIVQGGRTSEEVRPRNEIIWPVIFIFSLVSSFFAGHLQIFFYSFLVIISYIIVRVLSLPKNKLKVFLTFIFYLLSFILITSIQWLPTLQFILRSARDVDQGSFLKEDWFLPWQHLIQFIAPDFFGNPATGNYWGIWNYGEFIGYVGIVPLILAFYALIFRRDKKTIFFGGFAILSLTFALPTFLAKIPYLWQLPLISTSQPTRLVFITDFSLAILAGLGLDYFLKNKSSMVQIIKLLIFIGIIYGMIWLGLSGLLINSIVNLENLSIAKRNVIPPTVIFLSSLLILIIILRSNQKVKWSIAFLLIIVIIDLFRFGLKFTPFTKEEWIFPETKIINTLKQDNDYYRVMSMDRRIMPPNFTGAYKISDVAGYDPLYLNNYNQLVAAWERNKPDISPASFNRIITPQNYEIFFADLLGVKYVMSFGPLNSDKLEYDSSEGNTYLYINKKVFPRVFLVENVVKTTTDQEMINKMYDLRSNLRNTAVVRDDINITANKLQENELAEIINYGANKISIQVVSNYKRMLVLTDIYYPSWKAFVDGKETKIYQVDFALRGIVVPSGVHKAEFKNNFL